MLRIQKIVFVDDKTQKEISVGLDGKVETTSSMTPEEYCIASFHADMMVSGGLSAVEKFMNR